MKLLTTLFALALLLVGACPTEGGFEFRIVEDTNAFVADNGSGNAVGTFDVVLKWVGGGAVPNVQGYSTSYQTSTPGVTFGTPTSVPFSGTTGGLNMPNFSAALAVANTRFTASNDALPGSVSAFDGAILARVQYFAPANFASPIGLSVRPLGTDLTDSAGQTFSDFTAFAGVVNGNITAVPEPATTGLIGLALVGAAGAVRKRFSRRK